MATGSVGDGHQNPYERIGRISLGGNRVLQYRKGNRLIDTITRDKAPCWNADTPVEWSDDINIDEIVEGNLITPILQDLSDENGEAKILATRNAQGEFTEYHPIIQLFNEIIAAIIRDRMTKDLDRLHSPTSSRRMWQYLKKKYLRDDVDNGELSMLLEKLHAQQQAEGLTELHE
jgi:hypothetical protein